MKKYLYRKQTPLKWNAFLKYFVLPVFILSQAFGLYSMFSDLTGLNLPLVSNQFDALLNLLGVDMNAPGEYLWFVIGWILYNIVVFILTVYAWIGLLKWERYGYKALLITYVFSIFWWGLLCYFLTTDLFMVIIYAFSYLYSIQLNLLKTVCIVVIVFGMIFALLKFLLTAIYYHKRKTLFDPYYQEPYMINKSPVSNETVNTAEATTETKSEEIVKEVEPVEDAQQEESVSEADENPNEPITSETDQATIEAKENRNEEAVSSETVSDTPSGDSDEEEKQAESIEAQKTAQEEVKETQKLIKTNFCPQCGTRIEKADMRFCPNCGHAL